MTLELDAKLVEYPHPNLFYYPQHVNVHQLVNPSLQPISYARAIECRELQERKLQNKDLDG